MRLYTLFALLTTSLASGVGEIGKTKEAKGKDEVASPSTHMASMSIPSGIISMNVNTKTNVQGHVQTAGSMLSAMSALPQSLKENALVAQNPAPQIASTVSINVGSGKPMATAAIGQPSVVPGQGMTSNGQACACECLCGSGSFPPNAGVGAFGGFLGTMPGVVSSMSSAGASIPAVVGGMPSAAAAMGMAKRW